MARIPIAEHQIAAAKRIVQDLFKPNPFYYWVDFLFNDLLGWAAFILAVRTPNFSAAQILAFLVAGFTLYRAVLFVHELSHFRRGTFVTFHWFWNILCGFPLTLPSFIYIGVHNDHHKQKIYGTRYDPEYFPFALAKPYRILMFPLTMLVAPSAFLLRFLLLAPLSWILWPSRESLWVFGSSLAVGGSYRRPLPDRREKWAAGVEEFMTFAYLSTALGLMAKGILPWKILVLWYLLAVFILVTNALRSLVAHCDRNPPDHVMTVEEQILDSTDIPGNPVLTPLWAPVGLRYHATHHMFIGMPYHNLGKAHRRLMRELPEGSFYRKTLRKGMWTALVGLWKEASRNRGEELSRQAKTPLL